MQLKHGKVDLPVHAYVSLSRYMWEAQGLGLVSIKKLDQVGLSHHFPVVLIFMRFFLIFVVALAIFYFIINLQHIHLCQCVYHNVRIVLPFIPYVLSYFFWNTLLVHGIFHFPLNSAVSRMAVCIWVERSSEWGRQQGVVRTVEKYRQNAPSKGHIWD